MQLYEMQRAIAEANDTLSAADDASNRMAGLIRGRLRKVWDKDVLSALKRELRDFNANTGKWSNDTK
jgi:hypothetical protein